jgi:hypothetical protein
MFCLGLELAMAAALLAGATEDLEFFEKRVRPVLVERCSGCHSASSPKVKGGLQLDSREGMLRGRDSGPAIAPGDPRGASSSRPCAARTRSS